MKKDTSYSGFGRTEFEKNMSKFVEENIAVTPARFDEVKVFISCKNMVLDAYAEELYFNIQTAVSMKGGTFDLTAEEFMKYLITLVKARVDYVQGRSPVVFPTDRIVVPSFLSCVLSNIGKARHLDYGIELVPEMDPSIIESGTYFTEKADVQRISNTLRLTTGIGLEYGEGYTRMREGSFEFMTMTMMGEYIYSISKDSHPVYALLSSALGVRGIEAVLSPRITYGSVRHLANLVRGLAVLKV